jgi:two-component system response regulator HydG
MARRGGFQGGMPGNMNNLMKQAQKMQRQMEVTQKEMEEKEYEATAGGGAVTVKVSGKKEVLSVKLSEEVVDPDDIEMLEDLIVAATNENLERAIKEGRFREDLYHRLAEMEIRMPSLAECADDILPLAEFFRERFSKELKKETKGFSKDAIYRLRSYRWPGNVRELQNRIKRAVLLTETPVLELPDLNADSQTDIRITEKTPDILPLKDENSEREAIANALQACNGHREQTARLLNVNSSTLYRKMKKYGIR